MEKNHVRCGGKLLLHHTEEKKLKNGKIVEDEYYECQKCHYIIHVITLPSYEDYVLRKQILVPFAEVKRIKKLHGLWK